MSGGHFDYQQYHINDIADEVEQVILNNQDDTLNEWGDSKGSHFTPETIAEFERGLRLLRAAAIYAQRIDWLLSGDDGEDDFRRRLRADLERQFGPDVDFA
jgi:hypothetical protein